MRRQALRSFTSRLRYLTKPDTVQVAACSQLLPQATAVVSRSSSFVPIYDEFCQVRTSCVTTIRSFASSATPAIDPVPGEGVVTDAEITSQPPGHRNSQPSTIKKASKAQVNHRQAIEAKLQHSMKVEAIYVGSRIHIRLLLDRPEFRNNYKRLHKGSVTIGLSDRHIPDQCETDGMPLEPYMVVFDYGSAVFFNTNRDIKDYCMAVLQDVASDPVSIERPYTEEYVVALAPTLESWSQLDASTEVIKLKALDLKNIQVISQVLAQSVALDFYSSHVERTMAIFRSMNLEMAETANLTKINKQHLLQLVAENNIVMTEIIAKLGVHERYDIAWKHVQYGRIWDFLRAELEMDARFKILDMKLNLIQDNLKYFLEILQNRKSDSLEWTIIVLIGVEICLSLYELASKTGLS